MSFSINSKIFDIEDQDEINSLLSFLELNGKFTNGQICFKDLQQEQKYDKFRQLFSSLKQLYPEFQLRFTNSQNERNQIGSQITGPLIRANEQSINYDKSQTIQNQPYLSQNEHEENQNIQYYELNSSLIEQESQDSKMSIDDNLPQTVHSLQQIGLSQVQEIKNNHSQNDYQKINEQQSIKLEFEKISLQQIDSQFIILSLLDKDLANKTNDNYIIIHRLNQTERIPLQDNVILKMIEKIFFQEWKELINQLNLEYKRIDLYELKENNDVNQVLQQIQNFINKISYVDIEFCFYTNYTMMVQSKINAFLKSLKIHPFQYIDQFHLVSNMQNLTVLQEIRQQLNNNYRGILLYFSNLRPYKQENNLHLDLQFCRSQYYEKILVAQFKQFCINQFFNNEYFFLEMNFSHIIEYRELFEKEIKKYIQLCLASPFLLKFNFQCDQNDEIFIEKCFKEEIDNNQEKIIYLKKENSYLLFGITEVLIEILHKIMVTQIQKKTYLNKTVIHIVKQNLIHKYSGQHKFLNYDSLYKLLAKMGFNNQQIKGKDLIFNHFGTLDFQTLLQTLIMICRIRQQTLNQKKIQSIYQKLCSNKNIDYLNRFEDELFSLPLEGCSKGQKEQFTLTINILPTTINYFSIQKFILLKPKFLDSIIYDHLYQEFNDELVQKNSQIQFIKIEEGKYLLSCQSSQTVGQFENYFSQFQSQKVILNEDVLRVFELSRYKKLEFQKKNIYYKVDSGGLNLISKDKKALLNTFQTLEHYKPFILSMHSLKKQNLEENLENYSLVQARTGYIKYILGNILKQFFEDLEIELKEEQEISAYSIFHLNFSKYQQQIIEQTSNQLQAEIIQQISSLYYFEIKIDQETGKSLFEIIQNLQIYVTFKQQYTDYFITILGDKKQFQKIYRQIENSKLNENNYDQIQFSIYIEQFCIFQNTLQFTEQKEKFKQDFEQKGFIICDYKLKWTIKPKKSFQAFSFLSILIQRMPENNESKLYQNLNNFGKISAIEKQNSSYQNQSFLQDLLDLFEQASNQNHANSLYIQSNQQQDEQFLITQQQMLNKQQQQQQQQQYQQQQKQKQEQQQQQQYQQQQGSFQQLQLQKQQNQQINQTNTLFNQDKQTNIDKNLIKETSPNSLSELQNSFNKECLLLEFQQKQIRIQPPPQEKIVQFLNQYQCDQNFEYFQPQVDQDYVDYFNYNVKKTVNLYILQKPDKQYRNEFSNKIIYYQDFVPFIEKFISHNLIIICLKANKMTKYQILNKDQSYQIALKDSNQVLPFLWIRRQAQQN